MKGGDIQSENILPREWTPGIDLYIDDEYFGFYATWEYQLPLDEEGLNYISGCHKKGETPEVKIQTAMTPEQKEKLRKVKK